jgi:hypothetical protein
VPGDVRGNVGIDLVCEIEKHCYLEILAHDVHNTFKVVALGLPFDAALYQDLTRQGRGVNFLYEGVVLMQRDGQYQVQAPMLVRPGRKRNSRL